MIDTLTISNYLSVWRCLHLLVSIYLSIHFIYLFVCFACFASCSPYIQTNRCTRAWGVPAESCAATRTRTDPYMYVPVSAALIDLQLHVPTYQLEAGGTKYRAHAFTRTEYIHMNEVQCMYITYRNRLVLGLVGISDGLPQIAHSVR